MSTWPTSCRTSSSVRSENQEQSTLEAFRGAHPIPSSSALLDVLRRFEMREAAPDFLQKKRLLHSAKLQDCNTTLLRQPTSGVRGRFRESLEQGSE